VSAWAALGKEFSKKNEKSLPTVGWVGTWQSRRHRFWCHDGAFSLPSAGSARDKVFALGKGCFAGQFFSTLGKAFAECGTRQSAGIQ
jgi:hypothetical protein